MKKREARLGTLTGVLTLVTAAAWMGGALWILISGSREAAGIPGAAIYTVARIRSVLWFTVPVSCLWILSIVAAVRFGKGPGRGDLRPKGTAAPRVRPAKEPAAGSLLLLRIGLLLGAVLLIGLGIWNGGARDVLYKAIKICTECIGLG